VVESVVGLGGIGANRFLVPLVSLSPFFFVPDVLDGYFFALLGTSI
jgi:hypothetical protein